MMLSRLSAPSRWMGLGLAALLVFPLLVQDSYIIHVTILCLLFSAYAQSWNLLIGYTGIFNLGQQAFFGVGGYTSALLAMRLGVSPWLGLLLGGLVAAVIGVVVGVPCLRLRATPYIAIATKCMAEICRMVAQNLVGLTRGELGLWGIPEFPSFGPISFVGNRIPYYYLMLALFVACMAAMWWITRSPLGLALAAVKDSQDAAESLGVNVAGTKILVFAISSFMAGVLGSFYAHYILLLTPTAVMSTGMMTEIVATTLVGGIGTLMGPVVGAFLVTTVMEYMRVLGDYRMLIYGATLVTFMLYMPRGLTNTPLTEMLSTRYRRAPAKSPGSGKAEA